MAWLTFGMFLVSSAIAYAWWCHVRVIGLRQDLFDIRDEMWDEARALGCFDDPAYRSAREHLNGVATHSSSFTLPVLAFVMANRPPGGYPRLQRSENQDVRQIIDRALTRSSARLASYLVNESLTGWICRTVSVITLVDRYTKRLADQCSFSWMQSIDADFGRPVPRT